MSCEMPTDHHGCPPQMPLDETDIQPQLDRRRPAQSELTTPREEADRIAILSGVENGLTLGSPIALMVKNTDQRPADYDQMRSVPRPSHADYTYRIKYGIQASSGGGRASARETVGRVAAGAVAALRHSYQAPAAVRAAVSRALARSRTSRAS